MDTKKCTRCLKEKPHLDFGIKGGKPSARCKKCVNKVQQEYMLRTGKIKRTIDQPKNDLTDEQIGRLTIKKNLGTRKTKSGRIERMWLCECECGNTKEIPHGPLTQQSINSCGCLQRLKGSDNPCFKGCGEISGNRWDQISRSKTNRNKRTSAIDRVFDITIEWAWDLFLKQDRKCALTGTEIYFGIGGKDEYTASLDRIDSLKGYTEDNVQWIHKDVNRMKNIFDQDYFIETCRKVAETQLLQLDEIQGE